MPWDLLKLAGEKIKIGYVEVLWVLLTLSSIAAYGIVAGGLQLLNAPMWWLNVKEFFEFVIWIAAGGSIGLFIDGFGSPETIQIALGGLVLVCWLSTLLVLVDWMEGETDTRLKVLAASNIILFPPLNILTILRIRALDRVRREKTTEATPEAAR